MKNITTAACLAVLSFLTACATTPTQTIPVSDTRVNSIIIADPAVVYAACYHPGELSDQGQVITWDTDFGGCYFPPFGPVYINNQCDIYKVLRHELCHAITDLTPKQCDDMYNQVGCPAPYHFLAPGEGVGGHPINFWER